ncbi:MAG: MerR family transcriptional regulator [Deltaproteobacteria bacterium]|nr:MerR family transcriptional regulator [Deltaproteobacteria bacterium]
MNLTLSVEEQTVERARLVAQSMDTSINQLIRQYLESLAGQTSPEAQMEDLRRLSDHSEGHSRGWKFNREEIYDRT